MSKTICMPCAFRLSMMIEAEKVEKVSGLGSPRHIVHKPPKRLANYVSDAKRSISLSVPIFEFVKSRCSFSQSKKNNRKPMPPHQSVKQEQLLKSTRKLSLKEWILSSPSSNVSASGSSKQFSGKIHPSFENTIEASTTSNLRPRDGFCYEGSNLKPDIGNDEVKKDVSTVRQTGIKKRVRFKLPQVVDIFILDSADGYYFSN